MRSKKTRRAHGTRSQRREAIENPSISVAERLQIERKQIFKAMGIVGCCRLGSDSMLTSPDDDTPDQSSLVHALQAAHDLLNEVAAELQLLIEEHEASE